MRRTPLKRSRGRKAHRPPVTPEWLAEGARQGCCAVTRRLSGWNGPGREGQPYQLHHVTLEQTVVRYGGDIWDPRNCLRIATHVHRLHHDRVRVIPAQCLLEQNIAYAFELMGRAAYPYLTRTYAGTDPRIERAIAQLEVEQ